MCICIYLSLSIYIYIYIYIYISPFYDRPGDAGQASNLRFYHTTYDVRRISMYYYMFLYMSIYCYLFLDIAIRVL